jgi:hypothetical protein
MRAGIVVNVTRADRRRLEAIVSDRSARQKHVWRARSDHNGRMSKTRVEFKYQRIAEDEWQIEAHYPGAELRHIKGSKSKAEADEWLQGSGRIEWLRSQGYAK